MKFHRVLFLLIGYCLGPYLPCLAAELVSSNHQFGDLRLQYLPPVNDGGEPITKYKIEWDASNKSLTPPFAPSSQYYGSAEVVNVREEQEIIVSCRNSCSGTFLLSWGGRSAKTPLRVDATAEAVELVVANLLEPFNIDGDGLSPVRVTRKANGFAFKWRVAFHGISGDIGLIQANGDLLVSSGAAVKVVEVVRGSSDLYPGAYTNEVQTVSVRKRSGFGCEAMSGYFALSFEGKVTSSIDVDSSVDDFKEALESLDTIHTVKVRTDHHNSNGVGDCASRSWIITFTHLVHENRQGAGDIGLLQVVSSSLSDSVVTQVDIFENVKGTNPRAFSIRGLQHGQTYHCRVSAYNSLGFGVSSSTVSAKPKTQPSPPVGPIVSIPVNEGNDSVNLGKSLVVSWQSVVEGNGGDAVTQYKLEWYSNIGSSEVQKLTTSAADGITEIQSIKISADANSITGFFTLEIGGEITELIAHDADADGDESIEMKLERLSTVGDVEVSREYSWAFVPSVKFDLAMGSAVLSKTEGTGDLSVLFAVGDMIKVGVEVHIVSFVDESTLNMMDTYTGPAAIAVNVHKWSFGYEWLVTFASHIGKQPLMKASPANNWAGTNPVIEVRRVREGLQPLSGTLRLGFEGERTLPIPFDAEASQMKHALESLSTIGEVDVSRYSNNNGHNYFITFISELGDREQLTVDDSQLMGPDARARVATLIEGTDPFNYGTTLIQHPSQPKSTSIQYQLDGLVNGVPYFVRIRARNSRGFGYAVLASPSPTTPVKRPSSPTSIAMFPLSDSRIRLSWKAPLNNGGLPIVKYVVQWDIAANFPSAGVEGLFHEEFVEAQSGNVQNVVYCHSFTIDKSSSNLPRFARVLAYNGHQFSDTSGATVLSAKAALGKPGPVSEFNAFPTSNLGMMLTWSHPSMSDGFGCTYTGDGGSAITHYLIEYDEQAAFSTPATSVVASSSSTKLLVGGRDVLSGSESPLLKVGGTYHARITPFNSIGPGTTATLPTPIGPLTNTHPSPPEARRAMAVSASSIQVEWDTPPFDGGSKIQEYIVEYDIDPSYQSNPKNITIPAIGEVKAFQVGSNEMELNIHTIQATVAVTNEVQSILAEVEGVDEIQEISTTCDDVTAEVQMISTTAVDTNEQQIISLISDDVDEIQLIRLHSDNIIEVQSVQVSVPRVNEVQSFGIVISNINTDGDGVHSTACVNLDVGDPCQDIEDAFSGSFTVSFDFDRCGQTVGGGVNYCQLALSEYAPGLGTVSCSPGLVNDPFAGGDHCVSQPVTHSFGAVEGEAGTLQYVLNDLVDDNGKQFMTSEALPGKTTAVSVVRTGRIKTKGSCTLDPVGSSPATCTGEYELLYEVIFDAVHSSGDVPPLTVVTSTFKLDTTSNSYVTAMCPLSHFVDGCEEPVGAALDFDHGSFYDGESDSTAIESTKGSQPTGMISLAYECESNVVHLPVGQSMVVSNDGMSATFSDVGFVANAVVGQQIRFSAGDGTDRYRTISGVDIASDSVQFQSRAPVNGATYTDVEIGYYFSDWDESDGSYGVSSHCRADRIHTTLPITVTTADSTMSVIDWKGKIGALSVIDSSGIGVSRSVLPDLSLEVGLVWAVTFNKQPGSLNEMICTSVSGTNDCSVNTLQDSSILDGSFKLQTTWPHEYVSEMPQAFETDSIRWNSDGLTVKSRLEAITDDNDDKVFGSVSVIRTPYVPPSHSRWSGGYLWKVTFLSRGGNIPALTFDDSSLTGVNPLLEVSDEDSGESDLYQGNPNTASFEADDPRLARDGNQVSGSFALSFLGNEYHEAVVTDNVFTVQTGGINGDSYTALSADAFKSLFQEHVLKNSLDQVDVVRSEQATQWMGFSYTIIFRHEDLGGDVPSLIYMLSSPLTGNNARVSVDESVKGTEITGTFQLRFEGETTRPISHNATPQNIQDALNDLNSIAPSSVIVSGGMNPIRSGPSHGNGGMSTQVGGRIWFVTFASNVWRDPTVDHDQSFVPGNWVGPRASSSDTWSSGFSKAWGKNVGNVPMMSCLRSGLSTTNGALPDGGCSVSELIAGTEPLGGSFKLCLDSVSTPNGIMSVEADECTDFIAHNADGSSVEEKLEQLENVGDVKVTRSAVNPRNGGYTWTVTFLSDADGPCQQKDDIRRICNSPGNVPKLCDEAGATPCDTSLLAGSCLRPESCTKLRVLDASNKLNGGRFPGGNEKQAVFVKDSSYSGWKDGTIVNSPSTVKEYKLIVGGVVSECIKHNALAAEMKSAIQDVLDNTTGGSVRVDRTRSEHFAENGFVYYLTFYDTGNLAPLAVDTHQCTNEFDIGQDVLVSVIKDGDVHSATCDECVDGIVQRGDLTKFEVTGDNFGGSLEWNAEPSSIKAHLEQANNRVVRVTRTVLDEYGSIEWRVTFTKNEESTPPGSGNVAPIIVAQGTDTSGRVANVVVHELTRGSSGLSGTFDLDYLSSSGQRTFSFDESPQRMKRKLEEMSTIGTVFVTKDCYPTGCSSGGWGGTPVVPGTIGGFEWAIYFLKNPGSNDGFTFPPGSGVVLPPAIDHTLLFGKDATVVMKAPFEGSASVTGSFNLVINGEQTESIPYNIDASAMEFTINDLQSVGDVSVQSGIQTTKLIIGIAASVAMDGTLVSLNGGDLRKHLAPGDQFRIGGSIDEIDGAELVGSASLSPSSPMLSNVMLDTRTQLNVGETIRIAADSYRIVRNGVEVQQLVVHRSRDLLDSGNTNFYQIKVTIQNVIETTACLTFDSSAEEVKTALNDLPILLSRGGVIVTKSDTSSGIVGDAHFYKVYFAGSQLVGDVNEMIAEYCEAGILPGVDSTNSHVAIRTLIQGGKIEHQRITLSSDSGTTRDTPAFRLSISDQNANIWNSPCFSWGEPSLDINSIIDINLFSNNVVSVDSIYDLGGNRFMVETPTFIEGVVLAGDFVNIGSRCPGTVLSVYDDGKSAVIQSSECSAESGDDLYVGGDVTIVDSFTDNGASVSQLTVLTVASNEDIDSNDGLYKISVEFDGVSKSTSCLSFGATAEEVQQQIGSLFDYNHDTLIDSSDSDHISVTRKGDGSPSSGYRYAYELLSNGSSSSIGSSAVLGSNAPIFSVIDVGVNGGCTDYGIQEARVTSTASTTDESNTVFLGSNAATIINAGARLRASSSLIPSKIYTVEHMSVDGMTLFLTEKFAGSTTAGTSTLYLVGGGSPRFDVQVARQGVDEYVYDIFFTGSHWRNIPQIVVNTYGDGVCEASSSDIINGMSRGIGIKTIVDSDQDAVGTLDDRYALDRVPRRGPNGPYDLYVVPLTFTIHTDTSEVQRIIVKDDDNDSIWGSGQPSFKLSFNGEFTSCLPHDALDVEIEDAINSLISLCSGLDPCVTVTRSEDSVLAPNGHVFLLYYDSSSAARRDIADPGVSGLQADTSHADCSEFNSLGGETVVIDFISKGTSSAEYSAYQVPFGGSPNNRWLGESSTDLAIYRVSGTYWMVRFDESLENVDMTLDPSALSPNSIASTEPKFFDAINSDRVVIPNLKTGLPYHARTYSRTKLGISFPSDTVSATPSDKPEKMRRVSSGHAVRQDEIQSIVIAASHQNEVQVVETSAMIIPEVQEITLVGTDDSVMSAYFFSLRQPEVQVVKWSSGSPVTEGSFFLKLRYVDHVASHASGSIEYKELKTPCINYDATADDVMGAMSTNALFDGLSVNSVTITRSGNRSFSSDYGYSYQIHFVGGDVRGNVLELTSDLTLNGLDSDGGSSCTSFVSPTNDASLDIWTENDRALGTDTPRVEVIVDANMAVVSGEFKLSVTHFGQQHTTECIPWNASPEQMKSALELLDNVDSVYVERSGDGYLSSSGTHILVNSLSFYFTGGSSFVASSNDDLSSALFVGDIIKLSGQTDADAFYKIISLIDEIMVVDKPFVGAPLIAHLATRYFGFRHIIYFDGQAMHLGEDDSLGFMPLEDSNFIVAAPDGCEPLQAYYNNVLTDVSDIPGGIASTRARFKYNGGHSLPGEPSSESSVRISKSLTSALPMSISEAQVTQSLETSGNGLTFTITYGNNDGDVHLLVCNQSPALTSLVSCNTSTVMDGNEIRGSFYLDSSDPIPYNASPLEMKAALSGVSGIGRVEVTRSQPDGQVGYRWFVTFSDMGDLAILQASNSLTGKGAAVSVTELVKGNELGGSFKLSYGSETTDTLPFNVDEHMLRSKLAALSGIVRVDVATDGQIDSELGRSFTVTFLDPDIGDAPLLIPDTNLLTGLGGVVSISEVVKGSFAANDALHLSFELPRSCSTSDVGRPFCGDPITEANIELSPRIDFEGTTRVVKYIPDYTVQIIRTSNTGESPPRQLSGYFYVAYDGETSSPILVDASADNLRDALEALPGIRTVGVERKYASRVVSGVCIDATVGSSLITCSAVCSPCSFGVAANLLVRVGEEWYRVTSSYESNQQSFEIALVADSYIATPYVGDKDLNEQDLHVWTGGYEWHVSFYDVVDEVQPLTAPQHHILPRQAEVEIATKDCNRCIYVENLTPDTTYYIRAKTKNAIGWSAYSDVISETPKGIPSAPQNIDVNAISGTCVEVEFDPPVYGEPLMSYVIQWNYSENFTHQQITHQQISISPCTSGRFGSCTIGVGDSSPIKHEICGLHASEEYFVRVAATNSVPGNYANWSAIASAVLIDQVADPPSSLNIIVLCYDRVQVSFDWPKRNGGKTITQFVVKYDTVEDFSSVNQMIILSSLPRKIPNSGDRYTFDFVPATPPLNAGLTYFIKMSAVNSIGTGVASTISSFIPSGPPFPPSTAALTTLQNSDLPVTSATVSWTPPTSNGGYPLSGYLVEWWSNDKLPEIQVVTLRYTSPLSLSTFTLSFSTSPTVKKETSSLPWDASADLVRREILNLGWDPNDDLLLITDVKVTRSSLANGYQWSITFGDNSDRTYNDGDQVGFSGSVMTNGDLGSPSIAVSTSRDGRRSGGLGEVQYLQILGTGTLSGYYRLKVFGSRWSCFIPIHATAAYIEKALLQLSTISFVEVIQNDGVNPLLVGANNNLIHHYEIRFPSQLGNVDAMEVDAAHVESSIGEVDVMILDGNNALDSLNTKESTTAPGELPVYYGNSGVLSPATETFEVKELITGKEYFFAVSARNNMHGFSKQTLTSPMSIVPPLQAPGFVRSVTLNVNTGYSDSLVVNFEPPASNGGADILFYRVELDPTPSFDSPIIQDFHCPTNNLRTEWEIKTVATESSVIKGGSFRLELEADGYTSLTAEIPYDAVALSSNETGIFEELDPNFSTTDNSKTVTTIPPTNIKGTIFPGDKMRFYGQSIKYLYYEVYSVSETEAVLSEEFIGDSGVQVSTTRHYGGRGSPISSRINCQFDEYLCPAASESKSGSMQSKLEDLHLAIQNGVHVDRDGPDTRNGFTWRVTFLDDAFPQGSDYTLRLHSNSLITTGAQGLASVAIRLLNSGKTFTSCSGRVVMPSLGGLVKGLEYHGRVSARNSEGYSLPAKAVEPMSPKVIPGAPTGVTLDVVSASALRVIFGSPSDNGGDTITQYLIEWSTTSEFEIVHNSTLDYLAGGSPFFKNIDGLITGTPYYVRVRAKNSQGYGISQKSTPSSLNPHQKPSPPTNVKLGITSDTMLTVGWSPPVSNGGDSVTKYRIEWDTKPSFASPSSPPHKGYVDVASYVTSHTIQLLSSTKTYYVRVFALNRSGSSSQQLSTPSLAIPSLQVPGRPHSLQATPGISPGFIEVSWQRPRIPAHSIPCSNDVGNLIKDCPAPFGGSDPASDGGDDIVEYELEFNERANFLGSDGGRQTFTGTAAVIKNLYSERTYFIRVLARNPVGSGKYGDVDTIQAP